MAMARPTGPLVVIATLATLAALVASGCVSSSSTVPPSLSPTVLPSSFPTPTMRPSGLPTAESFASVPPADSAIVDSWRKAGVSCGEPQVGMPENRPQWGCQGTLRSVRINVDFMGDDAGMVDMQAQVAAATSGPTAVGVFDDLMAATPAFSDGMASIREWIKGRSGAPGVVSTTIQGVGVTLESDAMWITLSVGRGPLFGAPTPGGSD